MKKIIFVYNARSGRLYAGLDSLHKIISPSTYACRLCAVTYGLRKIDPVWEQFIKQLSVETVFLHRDEFEDQFPHFKTEYPVAFMYENDILHTFIPPEEMRSTDLNNLMKIVKERSADHDLS